jgi:hypothetical protein
MAYEQGLKPLKQIQLSTLSPVMWSLKGGYPRKQMTVPIGRESALGISDDVVAMVGSTAGMLVLLPLAAFLGIAALGVLMNVVNGREPFSY